MFRRRVAPGHDHWSIGLFSVHVLALALVLGWPHSAHADASERYRTAFADHFKVGVALSQAQILGKEPAARSLVARQFNSLTAENDMKWERLQPEEGRFDFAAADALVAFGAEHDMDIVGHVLVWHSQTPDWVFGDGQGGVASRDELQRRLEQHLRTVIGRYRGRIAAWDVVNEALNEDGSLRDSPWRSILGEDYVVEAFRLAHALDPEARLIYNDYNLFKPEKRAGAVRLVQQIQAAGVPIHAVGMQGHYSLGYPESLEQVRDSIRAFSALGVKVDISELDVSVLPFPDEAEQGADISQNLALSARLNPYETGLPDDVARAQAEHYLELFRIFLEELSSVDRVTFWGVHDGQSWRNDWPMAGRRDYPLTFDRAGNAKPVARALWALALDREAH